MELPIDDGVDVALDALGTVVDAILGAAGSDGKQEEPASLQLSPVADCKLKESLPEGESTDR